MPATQGSGQAGRTTLGYLERHAEPGSLAAAAACTGEHRSVVVIPGYDEAEDFLQALLPSGASDLLVIVVVNAPGNAPAGARARTERLLGALGGRRPAPWTQVCLAAARNVHLLVVDRVSAGRTIPRRQGVGLARKVGADLALALIAANKVRRPWIHATDADVRLPDRYLHTLLPASGTVLFPYRHVAGNPELQARADLYELHLRYYVDRLDYAGSPYAFNTLGSTMAVHADAYAKVRGYPRRNAGEDFYLMNKLAKVDRVLPLGNSAPQIVIHARPSRRVPFGTGPALEKIAQASGPYESYAPQSFVLLREALYGIDAAGAGRRWQASAETNAVMETMGFFVALEEARRRSRRPGTLVRALHQWFDGFRTLRFIHECRRFHPDRPLLDSLGEILGSPGPYLDRLRDSERSIPRGLQ